MEIKILGGGCPKCERLEALAREVAGELGIEAKFTKVKEMPKIVAYDVMTTPALVVDEKVMSSGRIPAKEEVRAWLDEANN
ncbi:TM0996/MTH895 family glutaredoxin-like protein [bacterium]|nr:TM0996/MTH895 family glutaredoxin-like protein [bacterium]